MTRAAVVALIMLAGLAFLMAAYGYRISPPAEPSILCGDLISHEMERLDAKFAIVGMDGLVLFYSNAGLVNQLDLMQKDRPGVSGGGMDDSRAYPHRDDVISVKRDVKGGKH